ncbi:MAG: shikimate dehydrogenase, partial [Methanoregula sp.]|nr:shikimate dehydrogenase [Methanoregula sp.]
VPGILGYTHRSNEMRRIVLTGFRGTGKTEIGRILASRLNVPFIDTDDLIETKTGRSIPDIFHDEGEERFRSIEREVIASLPAADVIVSTGGGVICDPKNMEYLHRDSTVVLLSADLDTIEKRLIAKPRPPLTGLTLHEEIAAMMDRRRKNYYASADFCVDTSETSPLLAGEKILSLLRTGVPTEKQRDTAVAFFKTGRLPPVPLKKLEDVLTGPDRNPRTRILGVAGYPCAHSWSPKLFNALFAFYHLDCHYTWFEDPELEEIMNIARILDVKGLSITIPFKHDVIEFLDEIDEHAAREIGAVNTVVFACGTTIGYNTDWLGVRKPLVTMKGSKAVLLGAGGVAAGAAYALTDLDMDVTILNRTPENAKKLAGRFGCRWGSWDEFDRIKPDLVVNATPLGMQPDTRNPLRVDQLQKDMTVFDLVYTPPITPLIEAARAQGCRTITGVEMFIEQAREQFYLFFGIDVPVEKMRELVL